jgi:hypothetical protein
MSLEIKLCRRRLGLLDRPTGCDMDPARGLACVEVRAAGLLLATLEPRAALIESASLFGLRDHVSVVVDH